MTLNIFTATLTTLGIAQSTVHSTLSFLNDVFQILNSNALLGASLFLFVPLKVIYLASHTGESSVSGEKSLYIGIDIHTYVTNSYIKKILW